MKDLLDKWLELKKQEREAKEARELVEAEIYTNLNQELEGEESQQTWNFDSYKLVIKPNFTVKVNQEMAELHQDLFKKKFELTYSQYKKIADRSIVDDIVTINQTKPSFTITVGE